MKHSFLPLALLIFVLGCKKYEAEYTVNCQFPASFFFSKRILLVTNADGNVLQKFDIPEGATSFSEQFTFEGKEVSEIYDLHLIDPNTAFPDTGSQYVQIYSHFDVPNGASVYLPADFGFFQSYTRTTLQIQGIESFDSLRVAGDFSYYNPNFQASLKTLTATSYLLAGHGAVINLRANGESEFRHLYLPDSLIADTVTVTWQDFKPENKLRNIEVPSGFWSDFLEVTAISPDFKHFVTLEQNALWMTNGQAIPLQFNHPDDLAETFAYRIRAENFNAAFEKIFQPGEALRFEPADMAITDFSILNRRLLVQTTGNIDLLRVEFYLYPNNGIGAVRWLMNGQPEAFKDRTLPDFRKYLPDWYYGLSQAGYRKVGAFQFDKYDYPQVREGFPFKSTEPYAVARSGMKAIWKHY